MLFADTTPEDIVIGKTRPSFVDLCSATESDGIEVAKDLDHDFSGKDSERVDADDGPKGELVVGGWDIGTSEGREPAL